MKQYIGTKTVRAARITGIEPGEAGARLLLEGSDSPHHLVSQDWMNKHNPAVGGYLVSYEDGYLSYCPARAFEPFYLELPETHDVARPRVEDVSSTFSQPSGHRYELPNMEPSGHQVLQFICKEPREGGAPGELRMRANGTTNEATILVLIDRLSKMSAKFPSQENTHAINHLKAALGWMEVRTARRQARGVEGKALA